MSPASPHSQILKLVGPLQIGPERFVGFRTNARKPWAECARISRWLSANGPVDICILGLGLNGHIAMSEPGEALVPHPHLAKLTRSSLQHAMLKGLKRKPAYGFTLGIGDILASRMILLLVSGSHKQEVLKRLLEPRVTTTFPASFSWVHGNTWVLCDQAAALVKESSFRKRMTRGRLQAQAKQNRHRR